MFVGHQVFLDIGFSAARDRLADLVHGQLLTSAAQDAYSAGVTGLARVGPLGSAPGLSRLVEVQVREIATGEGSAVLALRWHAIGPGGALFPALDADITLAPAGEEATVLRLDGAYRPPLGIVGAGLDRAILHRVATTTIQAFLGQIAQSVAHPAAGEAKPQLS